MMKHLAFLVSALLAHCLSAWSQTAEWASVTYGFEQKISANGVSVDSDGNVVSVGQFDGRIELPDGDTRVGNLDNNAIIQKLDSSGVILWTRDFPGYSPAYSVAIDSRNNIYVAGKYNNRVQFENISLTATFRARNHYVLKLDTDGNIIWAEAIPGLSAEKPTIVSDSQDNIYVLGEFTGSRDFDGNTLRSSDGKLYLVKLNSDGDYVYVRQMGSIGSTSRGSLTIDRDDNIIITGETAGSNSSIFGNDTYPSGGGFITKLDASGEFLWSEQIVGASGYDVTTDSSGDIYFSGQYAGDVQFYDEQLSSLNVSSLFIIKLTGTGEKIWLKDIQLGSSETFFFRRPIVDVNDADNLYLMFGYKGDLTYEGTDYSATPSEFISPNILISNLGRSNGSGELVWVKNFDRVDYSEDGVFTSAGDRTLYVAGGIGISNFDTITLETGNATDYLVARLSDRTMVSSIPSNPLQNSYVTHNLFENNYTVHFEPSVSNLKLDLLDSSGKHIKSFSAAGTFTSYSFTFEGSSGMYVLKVSADNQMVQSYRVFRP